MWHTPLQRNLLRCSTIDTSISLKIDDDIASAVESFNYTIQEATWNATTNNPDINIEYSFAVKVKTSKKRKVRKLGQTDSCSVLKNKLSRSIKALKNLLDLERNQGIQEYLCKLSATFETNYSVWKATKSLT